MESMYSPQQWHEVFAALGSGVAALAGLMIVAASVRADQIMAVSHWRLLAQNTTLSMIVIMVCSLLILSPQDSTALGAELVVINLTCAVLLPGRVIAKALRAHSKVSIRIPVLAASTYCLAAAGGISLVMHQGGGMYLITAAYLLHLPAAVFKSYALLLPHRNPSEA